MSTTAIGPVLDLDGPLPVAPDYGLLRCPGVDKGNVGGMPEADDLTAGGPDPDSVYEPAGSDDRWQGGVHVWGYPVITPQIWEPCAVGTERVKEDGGDEPISRFDPVGVYLPITCSALGNKNANLDMFYARAIAVFEATLSYAMEKILSQSVIFSNNGFLADSNLSILNGGAAVKPEVGIAFLEDAIGQTGRAGMLHITPAVNAYLGFNLFREIDPDGVEDSDDEYLITANGTAVASGGGYIGADPTLGPSPTATKQWAFATGPVEVRRTEIMTTDLLRSVDQTDNTFTLRPELMAVVEWDTALQAGVLIDWSL